MRSRQHNRHQTFLWRAAAPVGLAIILFAGLIFAYLLPQQERLIIERKKEMLRELTASALSILAEQERDSRSGGVSLREAQKQAVSRLRDMRYGREGKDYFWITDHEPRMVMHPYRPDLEGQNLASYRDPDGKPLFVEARNQVEAHGEGFIEYRWQWKDDTVRVVPKLSYVRGFPAWGYIVGTGIYLDDVHEEMRGLRTRLLTATLAILATIVLLMLYGLKQTLDADSQARRALQDLRDSEQKYRLLSEAVGEGSLLAAEGQILHPNRALLELLDCSADALIGKPLVSLFVDVDAARSLENTLGQLEGGRVWQRETQIRSPAGPVLNAEVTATPVEALGLHGLSIVVRDLSAGKRLAGELARSRERARWLAGRLGLGSFSAEAREGWPLLDADGALERMLSSANPNTLTGRPLLGSLVDSVEAEQLHSELLEKSAIHGRIARVRDAAGRMRTWSISAALAPTEGEAMEVIDGLIEDVTWRKEAELRLDTRRDPEHADLFADARPIGTFGRPALSCSMDLRLSEAAMLLTKRGEDACLVRAPDGMAVGLLSWKTLGVALTPNGPSFDAPCHQVMVAPIPALPANTPLFAALPFAHAHQLTSLPIRHADGTIQAMAPTRELLEAQGRTLPAVLCELEDAQTEEALLEAHARVPGLVRTLLESGASSAPTSRTLTALVDAFTKRAVALAVARMGPTPTAYTLLALGSEGRGEQTLVTDQDNAMIWSDVAESSTQEASRYFLKLGESVNAALDRAGYAYCDGKVMAGNPNWNMPLSRWKVTVARWIQDADPKALLGVNIFFDFRPICGDAALAESLRTHIQGLLGRNQAFFYHFAVNILEFRPPLGFFGKILTEVEEGHPPAFNVKVALVPLVGFARLYALHHGAHASSTLERLGLLKERGLLSPMGHDELLEAFSCLMGLRLRHQAAQLSRGQPPDNLINPKTLSRLELARLREALGQIQIVQERVRLEWLRKE